MSSSNEIPKLTGLLLGAGASQEYGMLMTGEISQTIRSDLTLARVRTWNKLRQAVGLGVPDAVIEDFINVLHRDDMNYENVIGYLEVNYFRNATRDKPGQHYFGLVEWLNEMIYAILYNRHLHMGVTNLCYLDGLQKLALANQPLWVFSLNHDVVLECAAQKLGLPLNMGFPGTETLPLPAKAPSPPRISDKTQLEFEVLTVEQVKKGLPFFMHGTTGINLMKLHGGLDMFTVGDSKDILKLKPLHAGPEAPIDGLFLTNKILPFRPPNGVGATNHILYKDRQGEVQLLRRTILSGAFKYTERMEQALTPSLMHVFDGMILFVSTLICLGYGFEDAHINRVLRRWLELTKDRHIEIVDPFRTRIPPDFRHLAPQVSLHQMKASQFLAGISL